MTNSTYNMAHRAYVKILLALIACLSMASCERKWHLNVSGATDFEHPDLCISMSSTCDGSGVDLSILSVEELDDAERATDLVWVIQSMSNNPLTQVKYGVAPNGWKVVKEAKPLHLGKHYRIEDHVFSCLLVDSSVKCTVN